jgi:hypothetical protein
MKNKHVLPYPLQYRLSPHTLALFFLLLPLIHSNMRQDYNTSLFNSITFTSWEFNGCRKRRKGYSVVAVFCSLGYRQVYSLQITVCLTFV